LENDSQGAPTPPKNSTHETLTIPTMRSKAGRREFDRRMEQRLDQKKPGQYKSLRRGWCFGDKAFRQELLGQMAERVGESHYGAERQASGEEKAEQIVAEELTHWKWEEAGLVKWRKGDPEKVEMALRLRRGSIMMLKWIAQRRPSQTHMSNCLVTTMK